MVAAREATVRAHLDAERGHDIDGTIATFSRPRYEFVATGELYDGAEGVRAYWDRLFRGFPDLAIELLSLRHADDAVIVETELAGTQLGPFRGLPPTGREVRFRTASFFLFDDDRLIGERVYYDESTILRQLGVARSSASPAGKLETVLMHPLTIVRGLLRQLGSS